MRRSTPAFRQPLVFALLLGAALATCAEPLTVRTVASVTVQPSHLDLTVGSSGTLNAQPVDVSGLPVPNAPVVWSTSNAAVATVTGGSVTAVSPGSATISATSNNYSGTATVSVTNPAVASVSIVPLTSSILVGQATQLTATTKDANGTILTGRAVSWSSSNTGIASVSSTGIVTGAGAGTATITATSEGKSGTATVTVTVPPVASVEVSPPTSSMTVGQTTQLTATLRDASGATLIGRPISWTTSNAGVASVSSSGLVTAAAAGSATITATSEGKSGTAAISVTAVVVPVASVSVTPATGTVTIGQTLQLTATPQDANGAALSGRTVTWSSSNTSLATVSSSGLVSALGAGSVTITATSEGKSGTSALTLVAAPVPVASVSVSPGTANVIVGQTVQLTATTKDASNNVLTGRTITWSSSSTSIATVSSSGLVSGMAAGTATVTATSEGKSGTSTITVTVMPVATVTITPTPASVNVGQTVQLTVTLKDANGATLTGRTVTWSSSSTAIATVSSTGLVTGVAAGSVTITATSEGKSGTASVTVVLPPVATVTVTPSTQTIAVGQTAQFTATLKDAGGNVLTGRTVTWSSSNTGTATISGSGLASGVAAGSATITATSEGKSGTASLTVSPPSSGVDFGAIVRGIRPRGYGVAPYSLFAPAGGRIYYVATTGNDAAAGTTDAPLRTINRAAQLAVAGDVVTIRAGTYNESVVVKNSGTSTMPIVFQAEQRGTVVLTGGTHTWEGATWSGTVQPTGEFWVTLHGLIFRQYSDPQSTQNAIAAVRVGRGWVIDDVLFDEAGKSAVEIRYSDVVIQRSTFNRSYTNAIVSWAPSSTALGPTDPNYHPLTGIVIRDVIISENNIDPTPLIGDAAEYVTKLWATSGALIDNIESYGNFGQGFWFDTDNSNFTIRNSYFHDNKQVPGSVDEKGKGLFLEVGWAPGLVERNVFRNNNGAGLAIDNGAGIEVRDNFFEGNDQCITLVNNDRGNNPNGQPRWPLKDINIHDNQCKSWRSDAAIAAIVGNFTTPAAMNIRADADTFDPLSNSGLTDWPNIGVLTTLADVRTKMGWETNGRIAPLTSP